VLCEQDVASSTCIYEPILELERDLISTDDHYRYVEYLQGQNFAPDWEIVYDAVRFQTWIANNGSRLKDLCRNSEVPSWPSIVSRLEEDIKKFEPTTRFEIPTTRSIFQPIFDSVKQAADEMGLKPIRTVELVTSTDISPTPAALPTTGQHLLFIGPGTSSFCNYWAKAITAVVTAIPRAHGFKRIAGTDDVRKVLRYDPRGIALAGRLALYYATHGTTLGFGEVLSTPNLAYRVQLLDAMETFAIAHEYSHFVAEERFPSSESGLHLDQSRELESFCDAMGVGISRDCANRNENFLSFAGIGGLAFLWAAQLCQTVRELLHDSLLKGSDSIRRSGQQSTHPALSERILAVKTMTVERTAADQREWVRQFIEEYDRILETIGNTVIEAVDSAVKAIQTVGESGRISH